MPEPKRPLKVFLSYASQDRPLVRELSRRLVGEGWIDTWQDEKSLLPGQDWRVKIEEAVEEADVVIICLSNHSVSKEGHVQKELRYAREIALEKPEDAIFLIPLRLDECEVPRGLRFYQWVDYFGDNKDSSYKALVASLKLRYEQKIKSEEAERLRKELQERERDASEKIARENAEKDAAEKARLKLEKEERQRIAKEKADREAAEKADREKQAREAKEKEKRTSERKEEKPTIAMPKAGRQAVYWFGGFIALILGIIFLSLLNSPTSTPQPTPENTQTQASATLAQDTVEPSATKTPELTSTPTSTLPPTPLPTEITDAKGVSMVLVPAGEFTMGSDLKIEQQPISTVTLDAFYIDKYEVSNMAYKVCVDEGVCQAPKDTSSFTRPKYFGNPEFDMYPVIHVDWNMADTYCEWRNARLPMEAEWEKAARGTDGRFFPWEGEDISCSQANYKNDFSTFCIGDTSPIGSYEGGISPYGIYDMAGNVAEWVVDWYKSYQGNEVSFSRDEMVVRGGSWFNFSAAIYTSYRSSERPNVHTYGTGFRCAKDAP